MKVDPSCFHISWLDKLDFDREPNTKFEFPSSLLTHRIEEMNRSDVEALVGAVDWVDQSYGFCRCPGEALHTTRSKEKECKVVIQKQSLPSGELPPGVYCFHASCQDLRDRISTQVRQLVGGKKSEIRTKTMDRKSSVKPDEAIRRFVKQPEISIATLNERSAHPIPDKPLDQTLLFLDKIYEPDDHVNIVLGDWEGNLDGGETKTTGQWIADWRASAPRWMDGGAWIRLNATDGCGVADRNIERYRFCLLECDAVPIELQLALFAQLPIPIAAIVLSGGKSAHAWVRLDAENLTAFQAQAGRLFKILGSFGIDQSTKNPSRLGRLPGATRVIGAKGDGLQRLLYLNPDPPEKAIV